jgi:septal ring factor EnvC (AmiA/AmiB activator)
LENKEKDLENENLQNENEEISKLKKENFDLKKKIKKFEENVAYLKRERDVERELQVKTEKKRKKEKNESIDKWIDALSNKLQITFPSTFFFGVDGIVIKV